MVETLDKKTWSILLYRVNKQRCLPFLGARLKEFIDGKGDCGVQSPSPYPIPIKTRLGRCSAVVLVSFVFVALTSGFVSPNNGSKRRAASQSPAPEHAKRLTFADRVAYQRRIEEVYWRHRIWPKERPDPKPSLYAVMSRAELKKKVADHLHMSHVLEDYWQWPAGIADESRVLI